jgi:hypothetical protein
MRIVTRGNNSYSFSAEGQGSASDLAGSGGTNTVGLTIGDDSGTTVSVNIENEDN